MTIRPRAFATLSLLAVVGGPAAADVIRVDAAAPGGDGTSWKTAFADLQYALAAALPGDEIWVAAGVYTPSESDAEASFVLADGVALYGGFAAVETERAERDWSVNETILSGDIGRDDVVSPWPGGWLINSANVGHVVVASGTSRDTVLDGFTVADGHTGPPGTPAGDPLMFGSGVFIIGGSPTIRNCRFTHNLAAFAMGGGVYCLDGSPRIEACTFVENYTHGGGGGAIFVTGDSRPEITGCLIQRNIVVATSVSNLSGDGAGIALYGDHPVTISACTFSDNIARPFFPVGDEIGYGGALWVWNGGLTVRDCAFINNTANYGAGLMAWGPTLVVNCLFQNNRAVVHPNDPYPELGGDGAGVMAYSFAATSLDLVNCTVAYNRGKKYVGAVGFSNAAVNIFNCIVRDNTGTHEETMGTWKEQVNGFGEIASSNITHIFEPHGPGEDPIDPENLPGVIDADALFVEPSPDGDLRLAAGSPCIDAADNTLVPPGTTHDLDGHPRFMDDPDTDDTGVGKAPIVDMGAYEFGVVGRPEDVNGDGVVNFADILLVLGAWGPCAGCPEDVNGDGVVNFTDLLLILGAWG